LALAAICTGYFLFFSNYFLVNDIAVSGSERVSADAIRGSLREYMSGKTVFVPNNHFIFLTKSGAEESLFEDQPLIREISRFKKIWPNKIEVEVVERTPGFALNVDGKNFLVDEEGVVVRELADTAGLIQVFDQVSEPVEVGERLNNTKLVAFTISAIKAWPGKIKTEVKEVRIPGKASTQVQFVSQEGWAVFFDVSRPAERQLSNLALIISRQIPAQRRLDLAYIDLRFEKWAYYCYKNQPCQAQQQPVVDPNAEPNLQTGPQKTELE
jgi:cell division septal protein FtsQ